VESGGNMSIEATDIRNESAKDISLSVSNKDTNLAGLYVGADANAEASVESNAQTGLVTGVDGSAQASAEAEASAGLRYKNTSENSVSGSVTNQTNSFKSGGDFTRTASNTIVDQGTSIDAGGDFTQSAREIRDEAIHDQTFSSSDKASHDARIGVYAGASAEAGADVGASTVGMAGASAGAGAEASIGVKAQYDYEGSSESQTNNTAVTSRFRAGGNINSTSTEKTSLVGTQFESGGDINIAAGSLDYQAAQDSSTSTNSSTQGSAELKVGILGVPGVNADASSNNGRACC